VGGLIGSNLQWIEVLPNYSRWL